MYKADFFRYCYLYKYGGYYFDIDIEPVLSITEIIDYKIPLKFKEFGDLIDKNNLNRVNCIILPLEALLKAFKL